MGFINQGMDCSPGGWVSIDQSINGGRAWCSGLQYRQRVHLVQTGHDWPSWSMAVYSTNTLGEHTLWPLDLRSH